MTSTVTAAKPAKELEGIVVANKNNKTIVVKFLRTFRHPRYAKTIRSAKLFQVHDEAGEARVGDAVRFVVCPPISKTKHMKLARVVGPGAGRRA